LASRRFSLVCALLYLLQVPTARGEGDGGTELIYRITVLGSKRITVGRAGAILRDRLLYADARDWINSRSRYSIFAFRNLCEIVGINPDALKRELHRIRRGESPRSVSLQRTFDVRSPSMSNTKVSASAKARTRRARAPMPASAGNPFAEIAIA